MLRRLLRHVGTRLVVGTGGDGGAAARPLAPPPQQGLGAAAEVPASASEALSESPSAHAGEGHTHCSRWDVAQRISTRSRTAFRNCGTNEERRWKRVEREVSSTGKAGRAGWSRKNACMHEGVQVCSEARCLDATGHLAAVPRLPLHLPRPCTPPA